jgi:putative ABC transport system permease protein
MFGDFSYAFRQLRKSPAFAMVAIITLALGVGANTAIFSVVKAVLLNQLPYRDPDQLVKIAESDRDTPLSETVDFTTTSDLRTRSHSFQAMSLYRDGDVAIVEQGQPELLQGMRVSYDYFDMLGLKMHLGRAFLPDEDHPETRYEAILGYGLWLRRFGGDPSIIGRTLRLSDRSFTVVGVLPASFHPLVRSDRSILPEIYMPLGYDLKLPFACRGCQHLQLIGRLKPGESAEQAKAELNTIMRDIVREHPKDYDSRTVIKVIPLRNYMVGRVSTALWVLLGAVGMVLLIACANVAHLALARANSRSKEMALRAALGAGRARLVRQMLSESVLLAILGGLAGAALAWWGTTALTGLGPKELPRAQEIRIDTPVLLFALCTSILTGLLFGLVPALRASRSDLNEVLKDMGKSTEGRSSYSYRNVLVILELALAFVLVMGAGLLGKSLLQLLNVNPGYDPHNVLTAGVNVYGERYKKAEAELNYYDQVMQHLRATPGIESVAMASTLPLAGSDRYGFHIQDRPLVNESEAPSPDTYSVSPDYFRVMRIPLKRGRLFTDSDRRGAPGVALISESCARAVFPNEDPIGKHIQLGDRRDDKEWLTIVGIVGDVRQYGFDRPSSMETYVAQAQNLSFGFNLVARTMGDPRRLEQSVRQVFLAVDNTQPIFQVQPLEYYVAVSLAARSFTLMLLGLFGGLALVLAAVGIYGVISYAVSLRTRELGIRMALGAARKDVLAMVLRQGLKFVVVGLVTGFVTSLLMTRFLSSLLFQVHPADLVTTLSVTLTLAAVAFLANYLPARRASMADPMVALRCE